MIQTNPGDGTIPQILGSPSLWRETPPTERVSKLRYTLIHLGMALREIQHKNPDIESLLGLVWGSNTYILLYLSKPYAGGVSLSKLQRRDDLF